MEIEDLLEGAWLAIVLGPAISFILPLANGIPENIRNCLYGNGITTEFIVEGGVITLRLSERDLASIYLPMENGRHVASNRWIFLTTKNRTLIDNQIKQEQRRIMRERNARAKGTS